MCTYVYVRFVISFRPSLHPWDPLVNYSAAFPERVRLVRTLCSKPYTPWRTQKYKLEVG